MKKIKLEKVSESESEGIATAHSIGLQNLMSNDNIYDRHYDALRVQKGEDEDEENDDDSEGGNGDNCERDDEKRKKEEEEQENKKSKNCQGARVKELTGSESTEENGAKDDPEVDQKERDRTGCDYNEQDKLRRCQENLCQATPGEDLSVKVDPVLSQKQQQQQQPPVSLPAPPQQTPQANSNPNTNPPPRSLAPGAPANFCNICNKELCNKYFMKTHMQKMHGINLDDYPRDAVNSGGVVCDICQKELCSKYFLKVHKSNTHGITDYTSGSAGSQAASAATAVAAIALNTLNNAQKRAINLATMNQLQSRQAAALLNAAAASAAFNPLQVAQVAKAAAMQQRDQMSHANSFINQLQKQQQVPQNSQTHTSVGQQLNQAQGDHLARHTPHNSPSPMACSPGAGGLHSTNFPGALLSGNQSLLTPQSANQRHHPFPILNGAVSGAGSTQSQQQQSGSIQADHHPQQSLQMQSMFLPSIAEQDSHEQQQQQQPDTDEDSSDRDSISQQSNERQHQQQQHKNRLLVNNIQHQFQNQQALLNAAVLNPAAAAAAMMAMHQQQLSLSANGGDDGSNRQQTAMDLRHHPINQLIAQVNAPVARSQQQQLVNNCNSIVANNNNVSAQYRTSNSLYDHQDELQQRQQSMQLHRQRRQQRRRSNSPDRSADEPGDVIEDEDDEDPDSDRDSLIDSIFGHSASTGNVDGGARVAGDAGNNLGNNSPSITAAAAAAAAGTAMGLDGSLLLGSSINMNDYNTADGFIRDLKRRTSPMNQPQQQRSRNSVANVRKTPYRLGPGGKQSNRNQNRNTNSSSPTSNTLGGSLKSSMAPNQSINSILPAQLSSLLLLQQTGNLPSSMAAPTNANQRAQAGALCGVNSGSNLIGQGTMAFNNSTNNNSTSSTAAAATAASNNNNRYLRHYTEACPICDRRFKSIKWLHSHVMNDHKNEIGNLFNLLVQVLLCGGNGGNSAIGAGGPDQLDNSINNTTGIGNAVHDGSSGSLQAPHLLSQLQLNETPLQAPSLPSSQSNDFGAFGSLSGALASLIGMQQQIQTLQLSQQQQQQQNQQQQPLLPHLHLHNPTLGPLFMNTQRANSALSPTETSSPTIGPTRAPSVPTATLTRGGGDV